MIRYILIVQRNHKLMLPGWPEKKERIRSSDRLDPVMNVDCQRTYKAAVEAVFESIKGMRNLCTKMRSLDFNDEKQCQSPGEETKSILFNEYIKRHVLTDQRTAKKRWILRFSCDLVVSWVHDSRSKGENYVLYSYTDRYCHPAHPCIFSLHTPCNQI